MCAKVFLYLRLNWVIEIILVMDLKELCCVILVMKKIAFRAEAIIRIQKTVKMFQAVCRHKPR